MAPWRLTGRKLDFGTELSEPDPYAVGRAVVRQRDRCLISGQRHAVELRKDDTTAHAVWVLDPYVIARRVVSQDPRIWFVVSLQRAGIFRED
jgi:hypothetical protein